jgi:hypothetical protein
MTRARSWDGLFSYFRKSVKLSASAEEIVGEWDICGMRGLMGRSGRFMLVS